MRRILLASTIVVLGCAHKQETKSAAPAPAAAPAASSVPKAPTEGTCASDLDCSDKQLCIRGRCVDIGAGLAECSHVRVHFAFNAADIDAADKPELERSARCLKADHALHVTIEGNADERGSWFIWIYGEPVLLQSRLAHA